jgi:hypothetical protein
MAVALHVAPDALLRSDDEVLDALLDLVGRERTMTLWSAEVAATTAELLHALWRITAQINAKKGATLPPPLRLDRPWITVDPTPVQRKVSVGDFAQMLGAGLA